MRRLAALSLLLLLLQSLGAGVALGQLAPDGADAHCTVATAPEDGAHANGHPAEGDDAAPGTHCSMPWMTGCGSSSACGVQAARTDDPAGTVRLLRATDGCPRNTLIPDSPSAELEAPPPRD